MKFGFATIPRWPVTDVLNLISQAEQLGYDHAWIPDQTFFADPFCLLAAAGQRTRTITLGIGVTNPYTRHPLQVARAIATVVNLTGRSVALGVGAGNRMELLAPLGLEQDAAAARCKEMIVLVRRLLQGERVTSRSQWTTLDGVQLLLQPSAPVLIYQAGRGPQTFSVAGEVGDGVIIGDLISDEGLAYAMDRTATGIKKQGRRADDIEYVMWVTCFVTEKLDEPLMGVLRPWVAHHLSASPQEVQQALGMSPPRIDAMRKAYREGGAQEAGKYVVPEDIDKLSLVGSPAKLANTVDRLARRGINQLVLLLYSKDLSENQSTLRRFAEEVVPLVSGEEMGEST